MAEEGDQAFAAKFQQAFEFYLIALVFTLLGLAVQTAPPNQPPGASGLELLGWVALMVSGIVGIFRLEWVPVAHKMSVRLRACDRDVEKLDAAIALGHRTVEVEGSDDLMPIEEALTSTKANRTHMRTDLKKVEQRVRFRYAVHKWGFIVGFVLLLVARAWAKIDASVQLIAV